MVTNHGDDTVSLLHADTLAVAGVVAVPGEPFAIVVADDRAYVSTSSSNFDAVSVIDTETKTVVATYSLAFSVTALAPARTASGSTQAVPVTASRRRRHRHDRRASGHHRHRHRRGYRDRRRPGRPTGKRLYVATTDARGSALVVVDIETARVQRTVSVGSPIRDIAFADGIAYVLTSDRTRGGAVKVVDLSTGPHHRHRRTRVGAPTQMTMSADKTRAYIVDYDNVTVLCTLTLKIVNRVTVDARPSCVAVDSDAGRLYVADYSGGVTRCRSRRPCRCCTRSSWRPIPFTCPGCRAGARHRLIRRFGSRYSAPLVAGLGAARLAVVRVTGDRALVGEPFEVSPRGHP